MVQFKNRYLVMEIWIDGAKDMVDVDTRRNLSSNNVTKAIKESILSNFGECGLALSLGSFQLKYLNPLTKICIIRTSREDHQRIWTAITMVRSIGTCLATFNLLDLSGNIKACKKAAVRCEEAKYEQYALACGSQVMSDPSIKKESIDKINSLDN